MREIYFDIPSECSSEVIRILAAHGLDEEAKSIRESVKRYGGSESTLIPSREWTSEIALLLAAACAKKRTLSTALKGYAALLDDPLAPIKSLQLLPMALIKYLTTNPIDGWIYRATDEGIHIAYAVKSVEYDSGSRRDDPPTVHMKLLANRSSFDPSERRGNSDRLHEETISWYSHDIAKKTAATALLSKGWLKETPELKESYTKAGDLFEAYHIQHNQQFLCSGMARDTEQSWRSTTISLTRASKMVNDEGLLERKLTLNKDNSFWDDNGVKAGFDTIPVHPYILFFDLDRHSNCWVHSMNCKPYVYDPELRNKLVLPDQHRDLIDILTMDMDVFMDDVIAGKSGGTSILCMGAPGLGKTLTAEVYSEVISRPLYRVHAGQLGVTTEAVEEALEIILRRAERWGAVLLIDEADVYIRRRDSDINHNAVVAAFLRTMEYFHGLLFMTTNRGDDVDDAIASRMIAMFKYETPSKDDARAIWKILAAQFEIPLSAKLLDELVRGFDGISGRDIKQLLKLTAKYARRKGIALNYDAFRVCAMFRGIA